MGVKESVPFAVGVGRSDGCEASHSGLSGLAFSSSRFFSFLFLSCFVSLSLSLSVSLCVCLSLSLCLSVCVVWCVWCPRVYVQKHLRVYVQNASVCRYKKSPCVPAPRPHVLTHAGVVPVHTGTFRMHTRRRKGRGKSGSSPVLLTKICPRKVVS